MLLIGFLRRRKVVVGLHLVLVFLNAAQRIKPAAFTGGRIVSRVYIGAPVKEVRGELRNGSSPVDQLLGGQRFLDQAGGAIEGVIERRTRVANEACETQVTWTHLGEDQAAEFLFAKCESGVKGQLHVIGARQVPRT